MKPINIINRLNEDASNKISSIDIYGQDYQFSDTLSELGYEYMLKLYDDMTGNNNIIIYKESSGNEDFLIIDVTSSGGTIYKVDHNGERLFLNDKESKLLSERFSNND